MKTKLLILFLSFVLSFVANAQVLQWAIKAGGLSDDQGTHSAVDVNGNVYVVGSIQSANVDFDPSPGTFFLSTAGLKDGFVAKYDKNGVFKWAFKIGGSSHDAVDDITVDHSGNVLITGYFRGANVDFDPSTNTALLTSNGQSGGDPGFGGDIFVAKYDTLGNYKWAFNVGGPQLGDDGTCISVDNNDNVLVAGYFQTLVDFDPSAAVHNLNSTNGVIFIAKYNSAGQYVWAINTGQGFSDNSAYGIKSDAQNNVIVTGYFQGTNIDFDPSAATAALTSAGGFDVFLAKYDANGQYLWAKRFGGSGADVGRAAAVDANNDIYITGDYNSSTINFNGGNPANTQTNNGGNDLFVAKFSPSGQHVWSFATGGSGYEFGLGVSADASNNIVITGAFTGANTDFDPSANVIGLSSAGGNDVYAAKYSSAGNYLCSFRVGGPGDDVARGVACFENHAILTGSFNNANVDFDPTAGSTLLSSTAEDAFFAKYDWTIIPPSGTLTGTSNCTTGQVQLIFTAASGAGPFTLYINNGTTTVTYPNIQSGVPFSVTPPPTVTTTYTLTGIKDANLCSAVTPANSAVTLGPGGLPVTTSGNTSICKADSVQLTASGGTTYQWSPATGLSNPSVPNPKASPAVTTTYKVIVTNGAGCKDSATLTVTLKPSPVITVQPTNATFCNGDSVQLLASGGASYQWSPAIGLSNANIANPKASPSATTTYKLVVTTVDGCKDSTTKVVTKNPSPTAAATGSGAICPADSLQLNASGGVAYQWLPASGLSNANISNPKASPAVNTTYKVVVTNAEGCKDSTTVTVTLKAKPAVTASAATAVCKGDSAQLSAGGGVSYFWYPGTGLSNASIASPKASPAVTTSYTVVAMGSNGCVDSAKTTVTVNQPPNVTISANTSVCAGDSVQLSASGGSTYQWSPSAGLSNATSASPKASPAVNTTYKVKVFSAAGCVDSASVTVTVKPKPVVTVTPSSSLCQGDTLQLLAGGGTLYQWSPATGLSNAAIANPKASPQGNTTYSVTVTNAGGCSDSAKTTLTVFAKPKPNLGKDTSICANEDLLLDGTTTGGASYLWSTGATSPTITVNGPGMYSVQVAIGGCSSPAADTITVNPLPLPTVSLGKDTTICSSYTLRLLANGTDISNYLWSTGSKDSFLLVNTEGTYTVTVGNKCGTAADDVIITVDVCSDDLWFPTAFTPNKDRRNDTYRAGYVQGFKVYGYELLIFNRWGQRVFKTNDVNAGWDGKIDGVDQPTGVFVWLAKYRKLPNGQFIVRKGTATLIR